MKKTKAQKEYQKQMNSHYKNTGQTIKKPKFNLFRNAFTQSKFFFYGIRILLVLVVIALVNNVDAWLLSFFR